MKMVGKITGGILEAAGLCGAVWQLGCLILARAGSQMGQGSQALRLDYFVGFIALALLGGAVRCWAAQGHRKQEALAAGGGEGWGRERGYFRYWYFGLLLVALVFGCSMLVDTSDPQHLAFNTPSHGALGFRLARVGSAAVVGAALAASGVLLQALLRNPLADPYVLGISTGASIGVLAWVISFGNMLALAGSSSLPAWLATGLRVVIENGETIPALIGAMLTCLVVFGIARVNSVSGSGRGGGGGGGMDPLTLLLVGVVVSSFNGALLILLNSLKVQGYRPDITMYLIGYINDGATGLQLLVGLAVFVVGWGVAIVAAGAMNVAALSDSEATSLGLRLGHLRTLLFIVASVMTAAAIALARAIGFVGLICPHVCRLLFGPDHRQLIITAPLCGAIFLMLADGLVQISKPWFPYNLPVGVVTALCGAPFFLVLLRHYNRQLATGGAGGAGGGGE